MLLKWSAVYVHVHYCTLIPDPLCVATLLTVSSKKKCFIDHLSKKFVKKLFEIETWIFAHYRLIKNFVGFTKSIKILSVKN